MPRITPNSIAMGVGASGAMTDVSTYASLSDGVTYSYGRQDSFRAATAGQFTFTLDNYDGRFTPGNTSSPYATPVSEGMMVCWQLGNRLVSGNILSISPVFPGSNSAWSQVRITCDDMLGNAARTTVSNLPDSIGIAAGRYAFWSFDGTQDTIYGAEVTNTGIGSFNVARYTTFTTTPVVSFGVPPVPGLSTAQFRMNAAAELTFFDAHPSSPTSIQYPTNSMGYWGFWITPQQGSTAYFEVAFAGLTRSVQVIFSGNSNSWQMAPGNGTTLTISPTVNRALFSPHYVSVGISTSFSAGVWTISCSFYIDGVFQGSSNYSQISSVTSLTNADRQPSYLRFSVGDGVGTMSAVFSRLSHTATLCHEEYSRPSTEAQRLLAIDAAVPLLVLDTLPSDLSLEPTGPAAPSGSGLDALNLVMRTEQGQIWSDTTGTLLAPVQKVEVRARNRPSTVTASFDADRELSVAPDFVRDITNMLASIDVAGPDHTVTVADASVSGRVGSASSSDTILSEYPTGLTAWGQDRLQRGENVNLRVASITVDALTTPTDRSASLLGLNPGDRVEITNLPSTQLGFTTWDGWLIGASETHSLSQSTFQMFFEPVLSKPVPVFDTDRFAAGGALSLASAATNVATTISVATTGPLASTSTPYTILVDSEQMTVTAVSGSGPQTLTVTRHVNGTAATAHSSGALVELSAVPYFAF